MKTSTRFYLLAVLVTLLPFTAARPYSKPTNIIADVKSLLSREAGKLSENTTNGPLIPSDDIVNQILSLLNCGPFPHAPNSHLEYSLNYTEQTLISSQTCDRYFKTNQKAESLHVQCKYKNWVFNKIQCERTTCPHLTKPIGGHLSTTDNTYNTTVYFWCSRGYTITGTDKLVCKENGLWNLPPPSCHLSLCRALAPPRHGFVSNQTETPVNKTIVFTCEGEYTLIGDAVLKCEQNGRWNTSAPVCKKTCVVSNVKGQLEGIRLIPGLQRLPVGSLIQQGQRIIFSCKPGSTVSSNGISTCIGGTWRPAMKCKRSCKVEEISNGKHVLSKDSSTVEYFCLPGYQLVGPKKLSCLMNITWDSDIPVCTKMCTVSKDPAVMSYRDKTTYEIIPFGSQVVNGTQMYAVCGSNSSEVSESECMSDGKLSPSSCKDPRVRIEKELQLLFNEKWESICTSNSGDDICGLFGYNSGYKVTCLECYYLDVDEYRRTSHIVLNYNMGNSYMRFSALDCQFCN